METPSVMEPNATVLSLPIAALMCRVVEGDRPQGGKQEVEMVVEEMPFEIEPGAARETDERLDALAVELRRLCEMQRQVVLEEADRGEDCSLEIQELNRLVELEDELLQELSECRGEIPIHSAPTRERLSVFRLCSLQGDVGGGCEAVVEGQKDSDPPLQTKIVSVEDVLRDIEGWWNPMLAEYQALVHEKKVVEPVTAKELARREATGEVFQIIPAKLIFSLKAFTARRKVRCVGCGNYLGAGEYTANQLYAGGLDVISLRCCLALMVTSQWSAGVVDIKTAFLNAELEEADLGTRRVIIRTPSLWRRLGICEEMFWDVHRAMYGLQISPAAWARCRDRTLPSLRLQTSVGQVRLIQFRSDSNIWAIVPADLDEPIDPSRRLGLLLVYVDDMMVLSTPQVIMDIIKELGKKWELSKPELLDEGNLHYRGVEVRRCDGGVLVHQGSYVQELLSRYPNKGGADVPALKMPEVAPVKPQDPQIVRCAQQVAGELLWLSGLTRPEIQFSVGALSRMIAVNAEEALSMGDQVLKYLRRYPARGLWYSSTTMTWGEEGELSVPMGRNSLVRFCDASFAPAASRSLQSTMAFYNGALIAWSSTRQAHTTLSTAEAELVAITSLFGELQALEPLVAEIQGSPPTIQMHSDSQAAIAICSTSSSNWRTRHLRLRASYIKEMLESGKYGLHHVKGEAMKADIGTKPLPSPRFQQLVESLGMLEPNVVEAEKIRRLDCNLEEKVKVLITCLVVASLLSPVDAHRTTGPVDEGLGTSNWQFLLGIIVVTICCWEVFKFGCGKVVQGVVRLIAGFWPSMLGRTAQTDSGEEVAALEGPGAPPETGVQLRYVDDVVLIGPPHVVGQQLHRERREAEEMDGTRLRRRQSVNRTRFQFHVDDWPDWPPVLSLDLRLVGQERWECRPTRRAVLRWHLDPRIRLFTPENTRPPVPLSKFTGRRRSWILDATPGAPHGPVLHTDD